MASPTVSSPPIATGPVSSTGTAENPQPSQESKSPTLNIPMSEMKRTVMTPERRAEPVKLSQASVNTLVSTLAFQYELIEKMAMGSRPASATFRGIFYEKFKQLYPNIDLQKPEEVRAAAEQFIKRGGVEVRLALKLVEWEAASLQASSGRIITKIDQKTVKVVDPKIVLTLGPSGLIRQVKQPGYLEKFLHGRKEIAENIYTMEGGNNMVINTNPLLEQQHKLFLKEYGWNDGALTDQQREQIDERLYSIAQLRVELYRAIGVPVKDIELNFIRYTGGALDYVPTKRADFIGEGAAGADVMYILEAEGKVIADEVKDKVQKELEKALEEDRKTNIAENTTRQVQAEAARIKEEADLDTEDVEEKKREIEAEIKKLEEERTLIRRRKAIDAEIADATEARDEAKAALETRATQVSVTLDNLIKWSADISESESIVKLQQRIDELLFEQEKIQSERKELLEQIDVHNKNEIKGQMITTKDADTGDVTQQPTPASQAAWEKWADEYEEIRKNIRTLDYNFRHNDWPGEGKSLPQAILDLQKLVLQRKNIIEDAETKELLQKYREAEKAVKEKGNEKTATEAKVTTLLDAAPEVPASGGVLAHQPNEDERLVQIRKEIKAKRAEIEKVGIGLPAKTKLHVSALTGLAPVYSSESSRQIELRIKDKEMGKFLFEPGPDWISYPPAVKAFIQLVWGPDVLATHPKEENKAMVEQVKDLARSKDYLDVIIATIESSMGAAISQPVDMAGAGWLVEGAYTDVANLFAGSTLENAPTDIMERDLVHAILENLRKKALRLP